MDSRLENFNKEMFVYRKQYADKTGVSITRYYDLRVENNKITPHFTEDIPLEVKNKIKEVFNKYFTPE